MARMPGSPPAHRRGLLRGASLVEIIVCVFLMSILATIAMPSLNGLIERQRTVAAVHALLNNLALTRLTAISRRSTAALCPSSDGRTCLAGTDWSGGWLLFLDRDGNRRPDGPDDIVRTDIAPISSRLRLYSTAGRQQIRYLADGRSAGSNLTLSICDQGGRVLASVIVNNAGRARSAYPEKPTACPI